MFTRFVICTLFIALSPMTVHAQLLKRGKRGGGDNHTTVVYHTGSVGVYDLGPSPVYQSRYYSAYSPVVTEVAPVVTASYTPVISYTPVVTSTPVVAAVTTEVIANKIPLPVPASVAVRPVTQEIKLNNPRETEGAIRYTLNNTSYSIEPGETQTIVMDRDWVIRFDNGYNKQVVYRLSQGSYDFTVSDEAGWDVVKRSSDTMQSPAIVTKMSTANRIPMRSPSTPVNAITRTDVMGQ